MHPQGMMISNDLIKSVTASLYERSLKKIPEDTKAGLRRAQGVESSDLAKKTLTLPPKNVSLS